MKKYKGYKYLLVPNSDQIKLIERTFECVRYVNNLYIEDMKNDLIKACLAKEILSKYRKEHPFLNSVDYSALINRLIQLQKSSNLNYYKKEDTQSYTTKNSINRNEIYLVDNKYVHVPIIGSIEFRNCRQLPENAEIVSATITKKKTQKYYISILCAYEIHIEIKNLNIENSIGLDYSSKYLFVDNCGRKADMPKYYRLKENRISKENKRLYKMERDSNNYNKQKIKIAKIYERTVNQRKDFLHKLSKEIANKYDFVFIEDLDMNRIAQHLSLAKNTYDNSYGVFVDYLKYKLEEKGKKLVKVNKMYPSSKICSYCGSINYELGLKDREWICKDCGCKHDRDINAAINIRNEGIRMIVNP